MEWMSICNIVAVIWFKKRHKELLLLLLLFFHLNDKMGNDKIHFFSLSLFFCSENHFFLGFILHKSCIKDVYVCLCVSVNSIQIDYVNFFLNLFLFFWMIFDKYTTWKQLIIMTRIEVISKKKKILNAKKADAWW